MLFIPITVLAQVNKYIPKYLSEEEIKRIGDTLIVTYNNTWVQLGDILLSEEDLFNKSFDLYQALRKLVEINDIRAESLAIQCASTNNLILKGTALHVFANMKMAEGVPFLLDLLISDEISRSPNVNTITLVPRYVLHEVTVMWAITQIDKPALPYLKEALNYSDFEFKKYIAIIISRIGSNDSLMNKKAGAVLTKIIDGKQDSLYMEAAIRGVEKLGYREAIPSLFALLSDTTIVDRTLRSTDDYGFTPNKIAVLMLKKFGFHVNQDFVSQDDKYYLVYEFTDLAGNHHKVMKQITEKQGLPPSLDERSLEELKREK